MHGNDERIPVASFVKGIDAQARIVAEFAVAVEFSRGFTEAEFMMFSHSKIVCTIGPPASRTVVERLLRAGMDVARLNFSHGTHEEHAANIALLR